MGPSDPYITIDIPAFTGGLNDSLAEHTIQDNEFVRANNVNEDRYALASAEGAATWGSACLCHNECYHISRYAPTGSVPAEILRVQASTYCGTAYLYKKVGNVWQGVISGTICAGTPDAFTLGALGCGVQYKNRFYWVNGQQARRYVHCDGVGPAIQDFSPTAPVTRGTISTYGTIGTLIPTGTYSFKYTEYDPLTTDESNPSPVSNVYILPGTPADSLVAVIPADPNWAAHPNYTQIRIYRTTNNGVTWLYETQAAYTGAQITVNLTKEDAYLGALLEEDNDPVPNIKFMILYNESLIGAGDPANPSTLYRSKAYAPWAWPVEYQQDIRPDDGDEITGIFQLFGRVFVQKRNKTFQCIDDPIYGFTIEELPHDVGCISFWSLVTIENYAYGLDSKGFWRFNGQQFERISKEKIEGVLATHFRYYGGLTGAAKEKNTPYASHDHDPAKVYYRCWLGSGAGQQKRVAVMFDTDLVCWFKSSNVGTPAICATVIEEHDGVHELLTGDENGWCTRWVKDENGQRYYEVTIGTTEYTVAPDVLSKAYYGGPQLQDRKKQFFAFDMWLKRPDTGNSYDMTVEFYFDGASTPERTVTVAASDAEPDKYRRVFIDLKAQPHFCMQVRFYSTSTHVDMEISKASVWYMDKGRMQGPTL